jgi:ABC-type xylose transport system substrate-binding protein
VKNGSKREAAYIIPPVSITKANWKVLYTSGFMKKSDICNGTYKKYC